MQKRWYDIGWADEKKCRGCNKEEFTEKHRLYHCPCWKEVRNQIPERFGTWEQKARLEVVKVNHVALLERRPMEEMPPDRSEVGIRKAEELGLSSRRFPEPCCDR